MILGYPVITADEYAHVESLENVSGCRQGTPGYAYFSLDRHVNERTCPAFLWHTVTDDCVPAENSLKLMAALQKAKVPYEAHLFPSGGHGLSVCTQETGSPDPYNARWMELCLAWLGRTFGYTPVKRGGKFMSSWWLIVGIVAGLLLLCLNHYASNTFQRIQIKLPKKK